MTITMTSAAVLTPKGAFNKKKAGTPRSAPPPKQMSCRFVRLNSTFVLTFDKSFGTGTYAMCVEPPFHRALKMDLETLPVLNSVKHSSTVYPMQVQIALKISASTVMELTSTAYMATQTRMRNA